ncbi:uncharacterized protein PHA67_008102 [Liasis olivaceus]
MAPSSRAGDVGWGREGGSPSTQNSRSPESITEEAAQEGKAWKGKTKRRKVSEKWGKGKEGACFPHRFHQELRQLAPSPAPGMSSPSKPARSGCSPSKSREKPRVLLQLPPLAAPKRQTGRRRSLGRYHVCGTESWSFVSEI